MGWIQRTKIAGNSKGTDVFTALQNNITGSLLVQR
jgi:hypothetical protein